jgi:hypothetical protein
VIIGSVFITREGEVMETCKNCKFWREVKAGTREQVQKRVAENGGISSFSVGYPAEDMTPGQCRRFPPRPNRLMSVLTGASDWCGEWKAS